MEGYQKKYFVDLDTVKSEGVYRNDGITAHWANDRIYAYSWHCPHKPKSDKLEYGTFSEEDLTIECTMGHKFKFSAISGNNIDEALNKKHGPLQIFDYLIEDGKVYILYQSK